MCVGGNRGDAPRKNVGGLLISSQKGRDLKKVQSELGLGSFSSRHFYDNPIQFVGRSAFQYLSTLHTL